jgi:hypothetical protein
MISSWFELGFSQSLPRLCVHRIPQQIEAIPVRFDPKLSRSLPLSPPPLSRHTGVSRTESSLEGGSPAHATTTRAITKAGALPEGAHTAVED